MKSTVLTLGGWTGGLLTCLKAPAMGNMCLHQGVQGLAENVLVKVVGWAGGGVERLLLFSATDSDCRRGGERRVFVCFFGCRS